MPDATWRRTRSATADATRSSNRGSARSSRWSRPSTIATRSSGRGRLPVCVVRMRSVLRFTLLLPPRASLLRVAHPQRRCARLVLRQLDAVPLGVEEVEAAHVRPPDDLVQDPDARGLELGAGGVEVVDLDRQVVGLV